ncbi:MAG: hypothetical protein Q7R81_01530 [Candidatus Peregrinibacteria bacterium]|nr:hypothetical protein [Candidatus Peregrinibacteria bacterium]
MWNATFPSMRAVEKAMVASLQRLEQDRTLVQSLTSFGWIMKSLSPY